MKPKEFETTPPAFRHAASFSARPKADALIIPVWKGGKKVEFGASIGKLGTTLRHPMKSDEFSASKNECLHVFPSGQKESRIIIVGLGEEKKVDIEAIRSAFGHALQSISKKNVATVNVSVPQTSFLDEDDLLRGVSEGLLLADYQFEDYAQEKSKKSKIKYFTLVGPTPEAVKGLEKVRGIVRGVTLTQDLVNQNADDVTPQYLIDVSRALGDQFSSIHTSILNKKSLQEEGLGLLLAVGRGAAHEPALIVCRYKGDRSSKDHTVVVGKGVTYDTGGLDKKSNMITMKRDMAGAGACLGLLLAAATTKLKANFTVVIPTAENAIGAKSYKPGDVYKSFSGKSVEIGNTDAEGRLILADALSYACKRYKPDRLIDFATLTGAVVVALGHHVSGLMATDDKLAEDLILAGEKTYERVCRLPLVDAYLSELHSDIADIKNVGGREAGSIKAALFLREFIDDVPWAHLDIAGTASIPSRRDYIPKYATGVGVRLMMEYFENRSAS